MSRIALGPRAGQNVLSLRTVAAQDKKPRTVLCADDHGSRLHAAVRFGADQRKQFAQRCRTITRPALARDRPSRDANGQVKLQLNCAYRDGITHIVMHPQEFMQRLAELVPRPRLLKRVFDIDGERRECGGRLKILAASRIRS